MEAQPSRADPMRYLVLVLTLIAITTASILYAKHSEADTRIASFNIRHLGYDRPTNYEHLADIIQQFDIVAIQEIMDDDTLEKLTTHVSSNDNNTWQYMASHAIGRGSYKEHYGFLWNTSEVEYLDGAVVFLDHRDTFSREPLSARFRSIDTDQDFALANIHVLYGDGVSDREPEIIALADYWQWLGETYPGTPSLLVGDFNYEPHMPAWKHLTRQGVRPAITQGATTLSSRNGQFASLYDNLWFNPNHLRVADAGIYRFPAELGITHEQARATVSDHAPVYIQLGNVDDDELEHPIDAERLTEVTTNCININQSSFNELKRLPHVGDSRADDITEGRPWSSYQHLQQINGIGSSRLADILDSGLLCE